MTLDEFIKEYDDTYLEVGGSANALNQCVDLANGYIMQVLNKEPIFGTNAKDFWTRADGSYQRITDRPPEAGDIVIWSVGTVGHIAVATGEGDSGWFQSFDQNWPVGSPCHLVDHDYKNVIGFLRSKEQEMGFSDEQMRGVIEGFCRAGRDIFLGEVKEEDLQKDVDFRFKDVQNGGVDESAQLYDYYKAPDCILTKKSDAQAIMDKELDQAQTICNNRVTAREEEIKNLKKDITELEGLLHTQSQLQQTQKHFSLIEFIKDLVNIFKKGDK